MRPMRLLRFSITVLALLALAAGYAASQFAFFTGQALNYAGAVDQPFVKWVALILLVFAVAVSIVPDREQEER